MTRVLRKVLAAIAGAGIVVVLNGAVAAAAPALAATPSACKAVGFSIHGLGPLPLTETWNGTTWTIHQAPLPTGTRHGQLSGVSCTSATACTAVGQRKAGTTTGTLAWVWNGSAFRGEEPVSTCAAAGKSGHCNDLESSRPRVHGHGYVASATMSQ
jgi:hypothetical protein